MGIVYHLQHPTATCFCRTVRCATSGGSATPRVSGTVEPLRTPERTRALLVRSSDRVRKVTPFHVLPL
jgi:hypothetical protein